jgi:phosphonatase-like hydrolase
LAIELVVFDLAGTTVKDNEAVPKAFVAALTQHHIEFDPTRLADVRGASKRQAVFDLIPEGPERARRAAAVYDSFREFLIRHYESYGVEPIEGAQMVFGELRAKGIRVALNTGFDREVTQLLLAALNWEQGIVDAVVCGDDVRQGRPMPYLIFRAMEATGTGSVRQVANLGDTVLDLWAGYNANVTWNIGVLSGAHDRDRLERAPHTHLLASIAEFPELLPQL